MLALLVVACAPRVKVVEPVVAELAAIDSLMWQRPDSALAMIVDYFARRDALNASPNDASSYVSPQNGINDSIPRRKHCVSTAYDDHYAHLLLAELLYKNDYAQTNREELRQAVAYFDSLTLALNHNPKPRSRHGGLEPPSPNPNATLFFLAARAHYINGVGYYERDSVVEACKEYLKALEMMEGHFEEKKLTGNKAQFMALTYTHLTGLFSDQYLHEQAIYFGQLSFLYFQKYQAHPWNKAWVLNEIGSNYNMIGRLDSADYYYHKAIYTLNDTTTIMHRDIAAHLDYLGYQKDSIQANSAIKHLNYLISISANELEQTTRLSYLGEILFHEKQYDSAWICLEQVFHKTTNIGTKRQAAERLVAICQIYGKDVELLEYASFLAPFANQEENKSEIKSKLTEFYREIGQRRLKLEHQKEVRKHVKYAFIIIVGLVVVTLTMSLLYHRNKRHKKHLETLIVSERQTHKMQQAALAGRLRQSNAALKKRDIATKGFNDSSLPYQQSCLANSYERESISQHILSLCSDKKNPIKSTVPISAYADIALTDTQKAQLKAAALSHYASLFETLKRQHPELKEKDFLYCYLCLLGLDNVQIAVLLQKSISTIWDREKRLQKILGSENRIAIILNDMMTD